MMVLFSLFRRCYYKRITPGFKAVIYLNHDGRFGIRPRPNIPRYHAAAPEGRRIVSMKRIILLLTFITFIAILAVLRVRDERLSIKLGALKVRFRESEKKVDMLTRENQQLKARLEAIKQERVQPAAPPQGPAAAVSPSEASGQLSAGNTPSAPQGIRTSAAQKGQ